MAKLILFCILTVHLIIVAPTTADDDHVVKDSIECYYCTTKTLDIPGVPIPEDIDIDAKCAGNQTTEFIKVVNDEKDTGKDAYCLTVEGPQNSFVARAHMLLTGTDHDNLGLDLDGCKMVFTARVCYCHHDKCNGVAKSVSGDSASSLAPVIAESSTAAKSTEPTNAEDSSERDAAAKSTKDKNNKKGGSACSAGHVSFILIVVQLVVSFLL